MIAGSVIVSSELRLKGQKRTRSGLLLVLSGMGKAVLDHQQPTPNSGTVKVEREEDGSDGKPSLSVARVRNGEKSD
jgi:hypothetical protein